MGIRKRKSYEREFKMMIVNLVDSGRDARSVAEENDIDAHMVRRWVREFRTYEKNSFQGNGNLVQTDEEARISQLEKELKQVRMERDI
ncbi:transposase [Halosquirtibacter laminarini]|uniref:Transposase n=1 Tax=Halosquirtibacter laminarini TaxID=3374600 RepID=A0AC61NF89_9BACT|nr:transposase [Prolixibacteraceae bacterium]